MCCIYLSHAHSMSPRRCLHLIGWAWGWGWGSRRTRSRNVPPVSHSFCSLCHIPSATCVAVLLRQHETALSASGASTASAHDLQLERSDPSLRLSLFFHRGFDTAECECTPREVLRHNRWSCSFYHITLVA